MIRILNWGDVNFCSLRMDMLQQLEEVTDGVRAIIDDVRHNGDKAVFEYTHRFDGADLRDKGLQVPPEEIEKALETADSAFIDALTAAAENIRAYHQRQVQHSWIDLSSDGVLWGQMIRPLKRVGIYVPGGTAAYPSSVLMNAIPAQVAGVPEIVMVSPPGKDGGVSPYSLAAAGLLGLTEVYSVGGAQAVAALAYGTETIRPVLKVTGPGNTYVTAAKKLVFGHIDIDMLAGPSEVFIIADGSGDARYAAADMLSQAEHDVNSAAILATPDAHFAAAVKDELRIQLERLSRKEIAAASLQNNGMIIITPGLEEALTAANQYAPEHLELMVEDPLPWVPKIETAGAVFVGSHTPEPVGDYFGGTNHILPTGGTAKYASPLEVGSFLKVSSVIGYNQQTLKAHGEKIERLALVEGLDAHAKSVAVRREEENS